MGSRPASPPSPIACDGTGPFVWRGKSPAGEHQAPRGRVLAIKANQEPACDGAGGGEEKEGAAAFSGRREECGAAPRQRGAAMRSPTLRDLGPARLPGGDDGIPGVVGDNSGGTQGAGDIPGAVLGAGVGDNVGHAARPLPQAEVVAAMSTEGSSAVSPPCRAQLGGWQELEGPVQSVGAHATVLGPVQGTGKYWGHPARPGMAAKGQPSCSGR